MTDNASTSLRQIAPEPSTSRDPSRSHQDGSTAGAGLLFLREEEIRLAQDLMFFAYRDFTAAGDSVLASLNLGRAHHRALHFIGRNPGIAVTELLTILGITKQSLARVLTALVERGYVIQTPGRADRRQRLLALTSQGEALERQVFDRQRELLTAAFREMGAPSVEGFRRILMRIMGEPARRYIGRAHARPASPRRAW